MLVGVLYKVKGTNEARKKGERVMVNNSMSEKQWKTLNAIRAIGGYIVHKPKDGQIGDLFCGWDDNGDNYVIGHDFGVIFPNAGTAEELREDLGDGWKLKDISTVTDAEYLRMRLLSAIFDDNLPEDASWQVFYEVQEHDGKYTIIDPD